MISGWCCLKLVFGLIWLWFLLSFCYRFVSRRFSQSVSVGRTSTRSVHTMLEAYQQLHFHSDMARNTMQYQWHNPNWQKVYIYIYSTILWVFFVPYRFTVNGLHPVQKGALLSSISLTVFSFPQLNSRHIIDTAHWYIYIYIYICIRILYPWYIYIYIYVNMYMYM